MLASPWIRNRFTLTFGSIALAVIVWNIYVANNNGGEVRGQVLGPSGTPAAGAMVMLARKTVASVEKIAETRTDGQGRYRFDRHGQYAIVITATAADGTSQRRSVPLWFRNQDVEIALITLGK